jgi:hypothetical protein
MSAQRRRLRVFLDNVGPAPRGWTLARTPGRVIELLQTGEVEELSLDREMGDVRGEILTWIKKEVELHGFRQPIIAIRKHGRRERTTPASNPFHGSPETSEMSPRSKAKQPQPSQPFAWPSRTVAMRLGFWIDHILGEIGVERVLVADETRVGDLLDAVAAFGRKQRQRRGERATKLSAWSGEIGVSLAEDDLVTDVAKKFRTTAAGRKLMPQFREADRRRIAGDRYLKAQQALELRRETRLLKAIKRNLPALDELLQDTSESEDLVYRFYHQSFKVYAAQDHVLRIVKALRGLLPGVEMNAWFTRIVREGTCGAFKPEHNEKWLEVTRPQLEAFWHCRYFLGQACRYGRELDAPTQPMPSGWAALLYLWNMR